MILQLRLSNSGFRPAMYPSSVVQTGVKSFGCENRIAQPLPIQSWKLIFPWVVSAVKLGASLLIRSAMLRLRVTPQYWMGCPPVPDRRATAYAQNKTRRNGPLTAGAVPDGLPRAPRRPPAATPGARAWAGDARSGA